MEKLIVIIILIASWSCKSPSTDQVQSDAKAQSIIDTLEFQLNEISRNSPIPGFAATIVKGGETIYSKGFGYSNLTTNEPFTTETIHTIASISKTFIGVAMMKLVEEGKVDLDDPINKYLPFDIINPHFPESIITIRHLVTHTSSINDSFDDGEKRAGELVEETIYTNEEMPESLRNDIYYYDGKLKSIKEYIKDAFTPQGKWYAKSNYSNFKPGEQYDYSNDGSTVAALLIEEVSGMPFNEFTRKYIFEPLRMNITTWRYKDLDSRFSKLYASYEFNGSEKIFEFPRSNEADYPIGDLKTNLVDLSKYLNEMTDGFNGKGTILNNQSYRTLFHSQLPKNVIVEQSDHPFNDDQDVGVFWAISKPGLRLHKGGSIGVYSILYFNPKNSIGVTALCNLAHPDFGEIAGLLRTFEKELGDLNQ